MPIQTNEERFLLWTTGSTKPKRTRRKRTGPGPEAQIQGAIMDYLSMLPDCKPIRVNAGQVPIAPKPGQRGKRFYRGVPAGTADIIGCYDGRFFALEVKAPGGKLTARQAAFLEEIREMGGIAAVVRSVDDAIEALK